MKTRITRLIPLMVLVIICILGAGVLTACDKDPVHTHSYTEWNHNDTEHWKECPEDHAIDETTRANHEFVVGECVCGATETVVPDKFGKLTGKVKLHKLGTFETDFTGINIDLSDDGAELDFDAATGTFTFENVKVGENHILTVTKSGYMDYTISSVQVEENQTATIAGEDGIILEYDMFGYLENWDSEYHDLSKVNDETPCIIFKEHKDNKTLNVITKESYTNVSATLRVNWNNSTHNWHTQGIVLKFEDGNHAIIRYHNGDMENGNIQYANDLWSQKPETSVFAASDLNQYGEHAVHTLLDSETEAIKNGDGLDLTVVVNDGKIYTYFAGNWVATYAIPEETADKKVQVAFFAFDAANNAIFNYEISETLPATTSTVDITVNKPADEEAATANVTADKESYGIGEEVTLSVTKPLGYKLETLIVNGIDLANNVVNNSLTLTANRSEMNIEATFVKEAPMEISIAVKGKKIGTTSNLAEGTVVTFKNTEYSFIVNAEGKITGESVVKGKYTVVVEGYFEKDIVLDENLNEILLEYDLMENLTVAWGWSSDKANLEEQNDGKLTQIGGLTQWVSSKDSYDSVAITATVVAGGNRQGVFIRFKGASFAEDKYAMIQKEGNQKVSWNGEGNIWGNGSNLCGDWTSYVDPLTDADLATINNGTYELTLVRIQNKIHVFVNGKYCDTKTLDAAYADVKCYVGVYCTDVPTGAVRMFRIEDASKYIKDVTITDGTAADAKGHLTGIPEEKVEVGNTVTLTIVPEEGYKLLTLKVNDTDVTAQVTGTTYSFVVVADATVTAEFTAIVPGSINAEISGNKFGVVDNLLTASDIATLSASGFDDVNAQLTASGDNILLIVDSIAAGTWTLNVAGYRPMEIVIAENTEYNTAIALKPAEEFTLIQATWGSVSSDVAADGSAQLTITNEMNTAVSNTTFGDIAVSVNLSGTNMVKDGSVGTQGIVFRFSDDKLAILRMQGKDKIQFAFSTEWFQGGSADGSGWQDLIFFTEGDKYLTAFDKGELILTAVRKGATIYAVLTVGEESEIIGCRTFADKYFADNAKVGMYCEGTVNGAAKTWKLSVSDAAAALAAAMRTVGADKISYLGNWTDSEGTLAVSGKGYVEFKADAGTVKESITMKLAASNATREQGLVYHFADEKYVAIRYQKTDGGAKVQFTMDTVLFTNASLVNWNDFAMNEDEITAFNGAGIDLTFIRDGATFYVVLGDRVLNQSTLDAKYATMDGAMGIMIWEGSNAPFAYEHKTGENAVVPQI